MFQVTSNPTVRNNTLAHTGRRHQSRRHRVESRADIPGMLPGGGYTGGSAGVRNFGQLDLGDILRPDRCQRHTQFDDATAASRRHLRDGQVLAEGIEDLQVSFACDTGSLTDHNLAQLNGQLDEGTDDTAKQNDEWWNNVPSDNLPAINTAGYCNLPTAVRLTLVVRTLTPDDLINTTSNGPMNVEDHRYPSPPSPADQYRRRVLTTTVYPRNNKP